MKYLKNRLNKNFVLLIISDILFICASIYLSILFRLDFKFPVHIKTILSPQILLTIVIIKLVLFKIFKLYRGMWRYTSIWDMINVIKANLISSIILIFLCWIYIGFSNLSRSLLIIDFMICAGLTGSSRIGIRMFFVYIKEIATISKDSLKIKNKILIIGAGYTGHVISGQIQQNPKSNLKVVGFLDDDLNKVGKSLNGVRIYGTISKIKELKLDFNEIYICAPSANGEQMREIVDYCKVLNKPFKTLPSLSEMISGNVSISQLREISPSDLLRRKEIILDKKSIKNFILGKRVIVTGAGGSIGSELVRQCISYSPSLLIMVDISELNLFQIERETLSINSTILFKPILCDIKDQVSLNNLFKEYKPQVVFHAAAYKHVPIQESFPQEAIKTNIFGSINLVESAIKYNSEKFVLVSTDKAVKPTNVMGATKRIAEMICQSSNKKNVSTEFMAVRFGNVLGSSGSVIPIFKQQIKDGGPLTITDPDMERYFMSIPEASQLILQAGSIGRGGELFILDMGSPVKILDLAKDLIRLSGLEPEKDILIKVTGVRPGEKKIEELSLDSENLDKTKHDKIFVLNNSKLSIQEFKKIIKNVLKLRGNLEDMSAEDIKIKLSKILPEYSPNKSKNILNYKKYKAEA